MTLSCIYTKITDASLNLRHLLVWMLCGSFSGSLFHIDQSHVTGFRLLCHTFRSPCCTCKYDLVLLGFCTEHNISENESVYVLMKINRTILLRSIKRELTSVIGHWKLHNMKMPVGSGLSIGDTTKVSNYWEM